MIPMLYALAIAIPSGIALAVIVATWIVQPEDALKESMDYGLARHQDKYWMIDP